MTRAVFRWCAVSLLVLVICIGALAAVLRRLLPAESQRLYQSLGAQNTLFFVGLAAIKYEQCFGTLPTALNDLIETGLVVPADDGRVWDVLDLGSIDGATARSLTFAGGDFARGEGAGAGDFLRLDGMEEDGAVRRAHGWLADIRERLRRGTSLEQGNVEAWIRDCDGVRVETQPAEQPAPSRPTASSENATRATQFVPVTLERLASEYRHAEDQDVVRRDICIRAIDAGYIAVTKPLANAWQLCGSDMAEIVADEEQPDGVGWDLVSFLHPLPDYQADGRISSGAFRGWYLVVFHKHGEIVRYELSNTHREFSPPPKPDRASLDELAATYREAAESSVKRDICLRAIDAGYISIPEPLANVRKLFGADFEEHVGQDERGVPYGVARFYASGQGAADRSGYPSLQLVVNHEQEQILGYRLTNTTGN